jgi:primosomal protein N' (replication factor Y)
MPQKCPSCSSEHLTRIGFGTQKIEQEISELLPEKKVIRMDADSTGAKNSLDELLSEFKDKKADVLLGTQMVTKGHDFPDVTLVGVLLADMSLYMDDYHANERTFSMLTQVIGRAGRSKKKGTAIIQTNNPDNDTIRLACRQDYEAFYEEEIAYRKLMGYPPAEELLALLVAGEDETLLETACEYLKKYAARVNLNQVNVIGPASPYVGKVNDVYRRVLYFKHARYDVLTDMKDKLEQYIEVNTGFAKLRIQFDFNPMNIF